MMMMEEEEPAPQLSGDSGNVSQSHSSASGLAEEEEEEEGDAGRGELLLAADYAAYLLPSPFGGGGGAASTGQIETLDKSLEDLLTRVDEFVGMLDMIRSDSSQVINESVPHIHAKAVEMRQLYRKIDKLEAFVKMVGNSVAGMEEQITKAESDLGTFPNTLKKFLHTINVPSFLNILFSFWGNQVHEWRNGKAPLSEPLQNMLIAVTFGQQTSEKVLFDDYPKMFVYNAKTVMTKALITETLIKTLNTILHSV